MNKIGCVLWRSSVIKTTIANTTCSINYHSRKNSTKPDGSSSSSTSSSSSSDSEDKKKDLQAKSDEKFNKLNNLLKALAENDQVLKSTTNIGLAKPPNKRVKKEPGLQSVKKETVEQKMVNAVKKVANEMGGNIKQTESELLIKLLNPETSPTNARSIMDVMKELKVKKEDKPVGMTRAEQVKNILKQKNQKIYRPQRGSKSSFDINQSVDLFGSKPLGIFRDPSKLKEIPGAPIWQRLDERELKLSVTHPPANYFQQLILWTEQGKLWRFPIDNEQGLDEEKKVYFAKHVFLEEHLEPWCPPKGPLRHFMELVCVGLSKNPYLTVEEKVEHISWYKNYFEEKKKLLQETGALSAETRAQKSIE